MFQLILSCAVRCSLHHPFRLVSHPYRCPLHRPGVPNHPRCLLVRLPRPNGFPALYLYIADSYRHCTPFCCCWDIFHCIWRARQCFRSPDQPRHLFDTFRLPLRLQAPSWACIMTWCVHSINVLVPNAFSSFLVTVDTAQVVWLVSSSPLRAFTDIF